jgi:hypothetical protein
MDRRTNYAFSLLYPEKQDKNFVNFSSNFHPRNHAHAEFIYRATPTPRVYRMAIYTGEKDKAGRLNTVFLSAPAGQV